MMMFVGLVVLAGFSVAVIVGNVRKRRIMLERLDMSPEERRQDTQRRAAEAWQPSPRADRWLDRAAYVIGVVLPIGLVVLGAASWILIVRVAG